MLRNVAVLILAVTLSGCGGGGNVSPTASGGGAASSISAPPSANKWTPGLYLPSSTFAQKCVSPRAGTSDVAGTIVDQNNFLRSWTNELYLWFAEVTDVDPSLYTTADFFNTQKTNAVTASGAPKDKFHFTYPTPVWQKLSQSGVAVSYGAQFIILSQSSAGRNIRVAYLDPPTSAQPTNPAIAAGLVRGDRVVSIDGISVNATDAAGIAALNAGIYPTTAGEMHAFVFADPVTSAQTTVSLQATAVTQTPVQNVKSIPAGNTTVGYIQFNDHIATSEQQLIDAVNKLKATPMTDLVLDIRYNGGGYLDIASELAYMIAGPTPTAGRTFEQIQFNSKHPATDPVTGVPLSPTLFHSTAQGFSTSTPKGTALPTLNLQRVFVLTGPNTCSASESIINSLRGVGVSVIQVGSTTCGKPYGFYPQDNCGVTYFSIEFKGVNAVGFGDYADGFSPRNSLPAPLPSVALPGCSVADDFTHQLGDANEGMLSVALAYRSGSAPVCPTPSGLGLQTLKRATLPDNSGAELVVRSPLRDIRILSR